MTGVPIVYGPLDGQHGEPMPNLLAPIIRPSQMRFSFEDGHFPEPAYGTFAYELRLVRWSTRGPIKRLFLPCGMKECKLNLWDISRRLRGDVGSRIQAGNEIWLDVPFDRYRWPRIVLCAATPMYLIGPYRWAVEIERSGVGRPDYEVVEFAEDEIERMRH